ncbi:MAG: universal stress protein [Trueperaceae bacterium]|nr:universal stress protein [Trueperaceae bacterium]
MKILHPTDFSHTAEKARAMALDLMHRTDGSLHIVHVQQRFENGQRGWLQPSFDNLNAELLARIEEARKTEVRRIHERLRNLSSEGGTHELRWGRPVQELLEAAEGFDLIVMGAHGQNRLDAYFLGGLAGRMVRRSTVPVLTVRDETTDLVVRRVLVATDFGDASRYAWHFADRLNDHGIETALVHVVDDPRYREDTDYARRASEAMSEMAHDRAKQHILRQGDPIHVLPEVAHEIDADVICVGVRHHASAIGLLLGSRADALLRSSPVPILSVPHRAED